MDGGHGAPSQKPTHHAAQDSFDAIFLQSAQQEQQKQRQMFIPNPILEAANPQVDYDPLNEFAGSDASSQHYQQEQASGGVDPHGQYQQHYQPAESAGLGPLRTIEDTPSQHRQQQGQPTEMGGLGPHGHFQQRYQPDQSAQTAGVNPRSHYQTPETAQVIPKIDPRLLAMSGVTSSQQHHQQTQSTDGAEMDPLESPPPVEKASHRQQLDQSTENVGMGPHGDFQQHQQDRGHLQQRYQQDEHAQSEQGRFQQHYKQDQPVHTPSQQSYQQDQYQNNQPETKLPEAHSLIPQAAELPAAFESADLPPTFGTSPAFETGEIQVRRSRNRTQSSSYADPTNLINDWVYCSEVPNWVKLSSYNSLCKICEAPLKKVHHKHVRNCRLCGHLFCSLCTGKYHVPSKFKRKKSKGAVRVCFECRDKCVERHKKMDTFWYNPFKRSRMNCVRQGDKVMISPPDDWAMVNEYKRCWCCYTTMSHQFFCRVCGEMFCKSCTTKTDIIKSFRKRNKSGKVRICTECRYVILLGALLLPNLPDAEEKNDAVHIPKHLKTKTLIDYSAYPDSPAGEFHQEKTFSFDDMLESIADEDEARMRSCSAPPPMTRTRPAPPPPARNRTQAPARNRPPPPGRQQFVSQNLNLAVQVQLKLQMDQEAQPPHQFMGSP